MSLISTVGFEDLSNNWAGGKCTLCAQFLVCRQWVYFEDGAEARDDELGRGADRGGVRQHGRGLFKLLQPSN